MASRRRTDTAEALRDWSESDTRAERLAGAILLLDGYGEVDPQHPLGGPDGAKDLLCMKAGRTYVAAVYFPNGDKSFASVKAKFKKDLKGAVAAGTDGIVFVTNQALKQSQRKALGEIAATENKLCEPIHRERIRNHLDSAAGYGVRLQHLRIEMNPEEQFAYFAEHERQMEAAIERQTREVTRLARLVEQVGLGQQEMLLTMAAFGPPPAGANASSVVIPDLLRADTSADTVSSSLTPGLLLALHRVACADLPAEVIGRFRTSKVWIGTLGATPEQAQAVPPRPEDVCTALGHLLADWNSRFAGVAAENADAKLRAIAQFHAELLRIHPFADGNGRTARSLLVQQCIDLLGQADVGLLEKGLLYQKAVGRAIAGDLSNLIEIIRRAVYG